MNKEKKIKIVEFDNGHKDNNITLSTDYHTLIDGIEKNLPNYKKTTLGYGYIPKEPIVFFTPKNLKPNAKNILITAGYHGEEPGGPWAIYLFLLKYPELLQEANISFLPVVNIWGFKNHHRTSPEGKSINFFLNEDDEILKDPSIEVKCLLKKMDLIAPTAKDGVLALHEDNTSEGFYLYVLGDVKKNKKIINEMKAIGRKKFDYKKNGTYDDNGTYELKDGIVSNLKDGTFEYTLHKKHDVPLAITLETPSKKANINDRIETGVEIIAAYIKNCRQIEKSAQISPFRVILAYLKQI